MKKLTAEPGHEYTQSTDVPVCKRLLAVELCLPDSEDEAGWKQITLAEADDYKSKLDEFVKAQEQNSALDDAKQRKLQEIDTYDKSSNVNIFSYSGNQMWLDKDTRIGLQFRFNAEKASGKTETVLWYGALAIPLNVDAGLQMLVNLEMYASACYDVTAQHKAEIDKLTTEDAVQAYDIAAGYPQKLVF